MKPYCNRSGLYSTPQTSDREEPLTDKQLEKYVAKYEAKGIMPSCAYQLRQAAVMDMLPTPQTQGLKVCDKNGKTQFIDLSLLPTPTAGEALKWRNQLDFNSQMGQSLNALGVNGLLPTPCAHDAIGKSCSEKAKQMGCSWIQTLPDLVESLVVVDGDGATIENGYRLNPQYTQEMMGFPLGWTELPFLMTSGQKTSSSTGAPKPSKPTATPSSPK